MHGTTGAKELPQQLFKGSLQGGHWCAYAARAELKMGFTSQRACESMIRQLGEKLHGSGGT